MWKYQPGWSGFLRRVREVIGAVGVLHRDLLVRLQVVRAEVQLLASAEEDVPVLENAAERDVPGVGKRDLVRPGVAVVFGQEDRVVRAAERLVVALRVDVQARRLQAVPEVIRRREVRRRRRRARRPAHARRTSTSRRRRRRRAQEPAASHSLLWRHRVMPFVLNYRVKRSQCAGASGGLCRERAPREPEERLYRKAVRNSKDDGMPDLMSWTRVDLLEIRRRRHCLAIKLNSVSAMFSQLPCFHACGHPNIILTNRSRWPNPNPPRF